VTRYRWVDSRKAEGFPVTQACAVAQVSPSAFHDWLTVSRHGPTLAESDEAYLVNAIIDIHRGSGGTYGVPRVTAALRRAGWRVNRKRVERLMRANHVVGLHQRRGVRTTIPAETVAPVPDLLGRGFDPGRPDVAWCGDITYVRTVEGWLYLASVLDLGSRRLLGYSMAEHMRTELVAGALDMAVAARGGPTGVDGVIFHGDRGSQYLSAAYQQQLAELGMRQSVGRTGVCWDNSVAEAFWSSLKRELIHRRPFATRADARRAIFAWINWYNRTRLHSTLAYRSPLEWEQRYRHQHTHPGAQAA
jgi:transposase InsO family protein